MKTLGTERSKDEWEAGPSSFINWSNVLFLFEKELPKLPTVFADTAMGNNRIYTIILIK